MKAIRQANIKILSHIENLDDSGLPVGDAEKNESITSGYYHYDGGKVLVTYSETSESGNISSEVQLLGSTVRVKRTGAISSSFVFREGERTESLYQIPPYSFDTEITTRKIRQSFDVCGGTLDLHYIMKIGGQQKNARMKIWIQTS